MVQSGGISATVIQNVLGIIKTAIQSFKVGIRVTDCRTFPCFPTSALQDVLTCLNNPQDILNYSG